MRRRCGSPVGRLTLQGPDPIVFTGFKGGPFNPESAQISLSAAGGDVRWSAQDIPRWIGLSGGPTGKLNKDSFRHLTVTPQAANLAPGSYQGRLTFRDDESQHRRRRSPSAWSCWMRRWNAISVPVAGSIRIAPRRLHLSSMTGTLSDDDLDQATRACAAAFQGDSSAASRRFIAEMGRAYAARAVRLAKSRADTAARAAMSNAVRLWQEAATKGSTLR